jgi:hypothetical protein
LQLGNFSIIEIDVHRGGIFFEVFAALGAGDRNDVVALRENQASASWPGVTCLRSAILRTRATSAWFLSKFSGGEAWVTLRT